ncbi:MAG: mandelate racemase/muconate lactonizing enzyme family protein [Hyphomicrobiaceae bacterium]
MKISRIAVTHHEIPLDPPFHPSWDSRERPKFGATIVRVETDEGHVGIGSGDAMAGFAGHEDLFLGKDPRHLARHFRLIDNLSFHYGKHWPLDLALWDLYGQITGEPVWRLLGGFSSSLPAYVSFGQRRGATETAEKALAVVEAGYKALKLRFFRENWREEIGIVEAVRAAVGDRLELMVDCNQAWRMPWDGAPARTLKDALAIARALEPLGVYWIEEPLHRSDIDNLRRLREATDIRIAGGELTREVHEAALLVEAGCYDVIQTDAALAGGISGLKDIAALCRQKGIVFTPHTWGNGVMLAAALHLTAGTVGAPFIEFPHDPPTFPLEKRDFMLRAPIRADADGIIHLSEAPGFGLDLDEERLAATRVG